MALLGCLPGSAAPERTSTRSGDVERAAVDPVGSDQERLVIQPGRERPLRADQEPLPVAAADELGELPAQLPLAGGRRPDAGHRRSRHDRPCPLGLRVGQVADLTEEAGFDDRPGAEFQRLEPLECLLEAAAGGHHPVVFQHHAVKTLCKRLRDPFAQGFAAGQGVGGEADPTADPPRRGQQPGVGDAAANAEGDQSHGVRVDDRPQVGTRRVNRPVERQLRRWRMRSVGRSVRPHANDVFAPQGTLVDARGCNPDVASLFANREVAAGGGGHAIPVHPFDRPQDRIARMSEIQRVGHVLAPVPRRLSRLLSLCGRGGVFARRRLGSAIAFAVPIGSIADGAKRFAMSINCYDRPAASGIPNGSAAVYAGKTLYASARRSAVEAKKYFGKKLTSVLDRMIRSSGVRKTRWLH